MTLFDLIWVLAGVYATIGAFVAVGVYSTQYHDNSGDKMRGAIVSAALGVAWPATLALILFNA